MKILIKEKLSEHKSKTPEGYLICQDAILARTGTQEYLKSEIYDDFEGEDTIVQVERKPEQVFANETLASFEDKPITVEHPDENVNPDNYSELAVGHTRNIRKGTFNGQEVMIGDLVITDASVIEDIENGIRTELSCGYDCDITEGDHPEQINIRGNHIALCEQGRAGIAKIVDSKKGLKFGLSESDEQIVIDAINELIRQRKQLTVEAVLNQLDVDMKGFLGKNKDRVSKYIYYALGNHMKKDSSTPIEKLLDLTDNKYGITLNHAIDDLKKYPEESLLGNEQAIQTLMKRYNLEKRDVIRVLNYKFDGKYLEDSRDSGLKEIYKGYNIYKYDGENVYYAEFEGEYTPEKNDIRLVRSYIDMLIAKKNKTGMFKDEYPTIYKGITIRPILDYDTNRKYYQVEIGEDDSKWEAFFTRKEAEKYIDENGTKHVKDSSYYIGFLGEKEREKVKEGCKRYNCELHTAGWEDGLPDCYITGNPSDLEKVVNNYTHQKFYKSEIRDAAKSLDKKDKKQLQKYLASISKHMAKDINIEDIIDPIKEMGFKPVRQKIDGWNKMDDGYYRKDYYFTLDGYDDMFMVSLYAKGNGDWTVNEVNAYFTGKMKSEDSSWVIDMFEKGDLIVEYRWDKDAGFSAYIMKKGNTKPIKEEIHLTKEEAKKLFNKYKEEIINDKHLDDSILQEYEYIRRQNEAKYGKDFMEYIEKYLALPENSEMVDFKYPAGYTEKRPKLLLSDLYYKEEEWNKFMEWFKKEKSTKETVKDAMSKSPEEFAEAIKEVVEAAINSKKDVTTKTRKELNQIFLDAIDDKIHDSCHPDKIKFNYFENRDMLICRIVMHTLFLDGKAPNHATDVVSHIFARVQTLKDGSKFRYERSAVKVDCRFDEYDNIDEIDDEGTQLKDNEVDYKKLRKALLSTEDKQALRELKDKIEEYYDRDLLNEVEYRKLLRTFDNMIVSIQDSLDDLTPYLDKWIEMLNDRSIKELGKLTDLYDYQLGKRWIKVFSSSGHGKSVFAFVDPENGDIYKAASWNSPAKGVRANVKENPPLTLGQMYRRDSDIDIKGYIRSELSPESIAETKYDITAQFASEEDLNRALEQSNLKDLGYNVMSDENACYLIYNKKDVLDFISDLEKQNKKDEDRYIVYAEDTKSGNRAMFWVKKGKPRYMYESDAPTFTKEEAEKIEAQKGDHTWVKKLAKGPKAKDSIDSETKYVLYVEDGIIKGTVLENYNARIQNANMIQSFKDFENLEQVISYLLKYTNLNREDIITIGDRAVGDISVNDNNYPDRFYEKAIKQLKKKMNKLEKDDNIKDENEMEFTKQKHNIYKEIQNQISQYEEKLVKDSDTTLETSIKEWYSKTYSTDDIAKTLTDKVIFNDLFDCLDTYGDVYELLGGDADSIVRERCFKKLAELIDCDYDYIYKQWLKAND